MDSVVYLNGKQVASHPYGYTGFAVDLSRRAMPTADTKNVVAVEVRNKLPSSRWYSGSGIYRNVHLVVTDPVHVARHGTYVTTPDVEEHLHSRASRTCTSRTDVVGADGAHQRRHDRVQDARGRHRRAAAVRDGRATAARRNDAARSSHPHLWSTDDPYLYTLDDRGPPAAGARSTARPRPSACAGSRSTPRQGFSLNGQHMKLQGVDLHHDEGALGAAVNKDALMRQMRTMKSMGVNAFRTSHNPPSPEMIEVCQELGIVMMVEAFDTWRTPKRQYDYGRFFDANSDARHRRDGQRGEELAGRRPVVDRQRDPRLDLGHRRPADRQAPGRRHQGHRHHAPDRHRLGQVPQRPEPRLGRRPHPRPARRHSGSTTTPPLRSTRCTRRYPNTFLFESESSSETSTRGVYQDPDQLNTGENYTPGKRATSSYDNNLASWTMSGEYGLKKDRDRRYFQGEFLWSGTDYIGEPTPYNVFPVKSSFFGAVDTAGFPKDAYWLFRSQWTKDPMVHLRADELDRPRAR